MTVGSSEQTPIKTCTKCGQAFPHTPEFFDRNGKQGLRPDCKPCRYIQNRKWVTANPHKYAEYTGRWREKHREQYNAYDREYRERTRERRRQQQAESRANNRIRFRSYNAKRYAMLLAAEGTYSATDIERLYAEQGGLCRWCSCSLDTGYEIDHVIPLSRGGSNGPENLAVTCTSCNRRKSASLPFSEWQPPNPL
ncbi:MAG: HNH endonuclease [Dehalococcoidia bacterium]